MAAFYRFIHPSACYIRRSDNWRIPSHTHQPRWWAASGPVRAFFCQPAPPWSTMGGMKNFPYRLIKRYTTKIHFGPHGVLMIFGSDLDKKICLDLINQADYQYKTKKYEKNFKKISLFDKYVLKKEHKRFKARLKFLYSSSHAIKGHDGVIGEAVNTLTANQLGYPSHQLCAIHFHPITAVTHAIYSRITDKNLLGKILQETEGKELENILSNVIQLLLKSLDKEIFHEDCHPGNIFCDPDGNSIQMIDLECLTQINATKREAFSIIMSKLYGKKLNSVMPIENFLRIVKNIATTTFPEGCIEDIRVEIEKYEDSGRNTRCEKIGRLRPATAHLLSGVSTSW